MSHVTAAGRSRPETVTGRIPTWVLAVAVAVAAVVMLAVAFFEAKLA